LAKRLQCLKRDAGLTQGALAAKSGVSRDDCPAGGRGAGPRYETLLALVKAIEKLLMD